MLVIAGKLICIYKIKLISISQKSCVFSWWLLAVCFLYEPDFNLSVLPAPSPKPFGLPFSKPLLIQT